MTMNLGAAYAPDYVNNPTIFPPDEPLAVLASRNVIAKETDPTITDVPEGTWKIFSKHSTDGEGNDIQEVKAWANIGGVLFYAPLTATAP